ncbi:MAG: DUF4956 domain-containing protein [Eubacteriales bacterium]|nr:DUF4956 domain-containing protein [Eubacteriales bacterium]
MNFSDIFKNSFLEKATTFSAVDMIIALGLSFLLGAFILTVYRKTYRGVMYSQSFGVSLMALTMITSLVILAVTSNVILSLGMVGALSIVRFRTAIKEPMDIAFLFWAIAGGIVLGAGLIPLAIFGSVFIGLILLIFISRKPNEVPYILVLSCIDDEAENRAMTAVNARTNRQIIKSKSVTAGNGIELTVEVRLKNNSTELVNEVAALAGIRNVVLVSYNGDFQG